MRSNTEFFHEQISVKHIGRRYHIGGGIRPVLMNTLRDASDFVSAKFVNGGDEKKNMPDFNVEEGARQ